MSTQWKRLRRAAWFLGVGILAVSSIAYVGGMKRLLIPALLLMIVLSVSNPSK